MSKISNKVSNEFQQESVKDDMNDDVIVSLKNVSKSYGLVKVLHNISVNFRKNRVTGFLGLNGAGKTTTMKIITTYLMPDKGDVWVNGVNSKDDPLFIRKVVGYLPENFPLFEDLLVSEFLEFVAKVKGVANVSKSVDEVMEKVGIRHYRNYFLRELSKGYRQRVGLAQAILGDPKVIILDEPTQGLDPLQIIEIRNLIKNLSVNKSVILSTHIMQEVEAICDDIVIIHKGNILLAQDLKELKSKARENTVSYVLRNFNPEDKVVSDKLISDIKKILGDTKSQVKLSNDGFSIDFEFDPEFYEQILININKYLISNGYELLYVDKRERRMEDLFVDIINEWEIKNQK